jgi:hypothetical protein
VFVLCSESNEVFGEGCLKLSEDGAILVMGAENVFSEWGINFSTNNGIMNNVEETQNEAGDNDLSLAEKMAKELGIEI